MYSEKKFRVLQLLLFVKSENFHHRILIFQEEKSGICIS